MMEAMVVDYGIVNLKNILRGLEYVGARVESSVDPDHVIKADRLVLPGVGAFESGINELRALGMDEAVVNFVKTGRPVLGICLGMQMLLDSSTEYGRHTGLGVVPGSVIPIPTKEHGTLRRKIPHIGWNALKRPSHVRNWDNSCLNGVPEGSSCYFVHSFMAVPENSDHVLAQCVYEGIELTSAIRNENVIGLQFHPERSGPIGLEILRRFVST
jgi:glutamine amidotransferase